MLKEHERQRKDFKCAKTDTRVGGRLSYATRPDQWGLKGSKKMIQWNGREETIEFDLIRNDMPDVAQTTYVMSM